MNNACQRTSSSEDHPASPSVSQEHGQDSTGRADSCGSMFGQYVKSVRDGSSGRTSPGRCHQAEGRISDACSSPWMTSGMVSHGGYWTRNTSEWPSGAVVSTLSEALETSVPGKYSLNAKACDGIIRRAEKRGKSLPDGCEEALKTRIREIHHRDVQNPAADLQCMRYPEMQ